MKWKKMQNKDSYNFEGKVMSGNVMYDYNGADELWEGTLHFHLTEDCSEDFVFRSKTLEETKRKVMRKARTIINTMKEDMK